MSNELTKLLDEIQFKEKLTLDDIAEKIGYSRPYISKAKQSGDKNKKLIGILKAKFPVVGEKVAIDASRASMAKDIVQLKALVRMLRHRLAKLEAHSSGRDLEEILDEQDADTKINVKDLVGGR